jgi:hypothetical protein
MYRGGKPEGSHQLVEAITEGAVGEKNYSGKLQWLKGLAACIQCESGDLEDMP